MITGQNNLPGDMDKYMQNPKRPVNPGTLPTGDDKGDISLQKPKAPTGFPIISPGTPTGDKGTQPNVIDKPTTMPVGGTDPIYNPNKPVYADGEIDPTTGTVEGRIANMMKSGNPLLEEARHASNRQYQARGLMDSKSAGEGGTLAMLRAAREIAEPDAATYANKALLEQKFGYDMSQMSQQHQNALEVLQNQHGFNMEMLTKQIDFDKIALEQNLDMDERQMMTNTFGSMFNNMLSNVTSIMAHPTLSADGKRKSVQELLDYFQDQITTFADLNSYDINWEF